MISLYRGSLRRGKCCQTSTAALEELGIYLVQRGSQEKTCYQRLLPAQTDSVKILGTNLCHFYICTVKDALLTPG